MRKIYFYIVLAFVVGCKKEATPLPEKPYQFEHETGIDSATYHTDTAYEYEYRTGTPGDYEYTYEVSGYDTAGQAVTGTVTMERKYGTGTLTTSGGVEVVVEVEWVGYGALAATDEKGNDYNLTVE